VAQHSGNEEELQEQYLALLNQCQSLQISSLNGEQPESSYAPFIMRDARLFIFVSELATHTLNMLHHPYAGVMLLEPRTPKNLFTRKRITFNCRVEDIAREDAHYDELLGQMEQELGSTVGLLKTLSDFHLLCLVPLQGRFITGFGKAYEISPDNHTLHHIDADQLRRSSGED